MKQYYDILGLPVTASKAQVKKAYRRLVMLYHPDRNTSPEAQARFLLIQKAYDAINSGQPTSLHQKEETAFEKRKRESEIRYKKARERYNYKRAQEQQRENQYYQQLTTGKQWMVFKTMSFACALLALLLVVEYFLPHHYQKDTIHGYSKDIYGGLINPSVMLVELEDQGKFWVFNTGYARPFDYHTCYVERSWIFHQPIALHHPQDGRNYFIYPIDFTANVFFPFSVILLLIPLFTIFFKRKTTSFSILYHTSYYLIFVLAILFLATEDRWLHFLTAGFA